MKQKVFFFDIDGTLTDERTHQVVPSAKVAIQYLQEVGHFVAIATGRMHYKTVDIARELGIHHFVCGGGGCLVLNDEIQCDERLNDELVQAYLKQADTNQMGYLLLREDNDSVEMKDFRFLEQAGFRKELTTYHYRPRLDVSNLKDTYKIYLAVRQENEKKYPWIESLGHLRMTKDYIVVQYDKKNEGIRKLLAIIQADLNQVVVFGDGNNDKAMFEPEYFKVAMGNGEPSLKDMADYVTDNSYDDGIYKACEHFGWFEK
ncbi:MULTISPECIES: HAD-IIB family hydrolase [Terrabacteria group]|uniref:HAD-IIB family hydrolase n=1 Tax=Bacillati TaxID=1783272 RepID=UPI001C6E9ABD|nr:MULTISPECIES: HAD family hydrolase [Terrabacteria group]MBW9212060.1 Cof-type HAD-IIB family hydrolase [Trueperella sp. zg.1013]